MAALQGHLMRFKRDPAGALGSAPALLAELEQTAAAPAAE